MRVFMHAWSAKRDERDGISLGDLIEIYRFLQQSGTFSFRSLENGLFPASCLRSEYEYTRYGKIWVRDNIYVAYSHLIGGCPDVASKNLKALAAYFLKHKWRFEGIIKGNLDSKEPMNRPHIRFNGEDLSESKQKWAHAENDALGYFLWLFSKLARERLLVIGPDEKELLTLFVLFFEEIRYWEDEDSGHWEEVRKIEASSIGVVVAALRELRTFLEEDGVDGYCFDDRYLTIDLIDELVQRGYKNLCAILPAECVQSDQEKNRRYDAALLFLIYPMKVVSDEIAEQIVNDARNKLLGDYGIKRYLGDSYWCADYKAKLRPEERTVDVSDDMASRDKWCAEGEEAQWCIFDPIVSIIHGLRYQNSHYEEDLENQIRHLNRSLDQLTGDDSEFGPYKCPELYYLEKGRYVTNDTVPLLWTQANLWMAFRFMEESLRLADR